LIVCLNNILLSKSRSCAGHGGGDLFSRAKTKGKKGRSGIKRAAKNLDKLFSHAVAREISSRFFGFYSNGFLVGE